MKTKTYLILFAIFLVLVIVVYFMKKRNEALKKAIETQRKLKAGYNTDTTNK